jgi:hypothetical protein
LKKRTEIPNKKLKLSSCLGVNSCQEFPVEWNKWINSTTNFKRSDEIQFLHNCHWMNNETDFISLCIKRVKCSFCFLKWNDVYSVIMSE